MTSEVAMQAHIRAAQTTMEAVVHASKAFSPMIVVIKDNVPVVHMIPPDGDGAVIQMVSRVAADMFEADEILMISDTYTADEPMNPYTMKPWMRGDMENLAMHHQGVERGWVRDCLMLMFARRSGDHMMHTMPYKVTPDAGEGREITWLEPKMLAEGVDGGHVTGLFAGVFEPTGIFESGEERPSVELGMKFLRQMGATVLP